jgi:hypothetical protein
MTLTRLPALLGLCACALAAAAPAAAQTVYRCGPGGSSYSQTPCPGGRAIDVDDSRTPEQQQQAQSAADRDARLGAALERDRRMEEALAAQRSSGPAAIGPSSDGDAAGVRRTLEVVPHYSNRNARSSRATPPKFEAPAAIMPLSGQPAKSSPKSNAASVTASGTGPARAAVKSTPKVSRAAAE